MSTSQAGIVCRSDGGNSRRITMIDIGVPSGASRRSKMAFWTVGAVLRVATGTIATGFAHPVEAFLLGAFGVGILAGLTVGVVAVVLFWRPAIRA